MTKAVAAVPGQVIGGRPEMGVGWGEERPLIEGVQVSESIEALWQLTKSFRLCNNYKT